MLCTSLVAVHLFALMLSLGAGVGLKHATQASLTLLQLHHGVVLEHTNSICFRGN